MQYHILPTNDHDKKLRYEQIDVYCYSKKQLDKRYPEKNYRIIGEAKPKNKKKELAQLALDAKKDPYIISELGSHSKLLYKRAGYVHVGNNEYVAMLKSRWPFLLLLLLLLALLALLLSLLLRGEGPIVIQPDHPLPEKDAYVELIEDDNSEKAAVAEGGGSVSMIYTLEARATLSDGAVEIYFKNPNASSHNVVTELYLVSADREILVARSGLIEPGFELHRLDLDSEAVTLSEGVYTGLYKVQCYDPVTGERALVAPEITGVTVTVTNG